MCIAYADQLKEICSSIFGIPVQRFYQNKSNAWICINDKFQYTEIKPEEESIVTSEDYYYNASGLKQIGWLKEGNTWYYLKSNGAMATGWLKLGDAWYYLNSDGSMQTASARINGVWYQFDRSGRML